MTVAPDTEDRTWVIDERCPGGGFGAVARPLAARPDLIRRPAAARGIVLARHVAHHPVHQRPDIGG